MNFKKAILKVLIALAITSLHSAAKADIYSDNGIPIDIKTKIEKIVDSPSHMEGIDDFRRKPRKQRIKDNIMWYKKYGKVNNRYNDYCLDIENFGNQDNFINFSTGFKPQEGCDASQRKFSVDNKLALHSAVSKKYKNLLSCKDYTFPKNKRRPDQELCNYNLRRKAIKNPAIPITQVIAGFSLSAVCFFIIKYL